MSTATHHIAIIGAGPVGVALAKQLVPFGHSVTISNFRGPHSLRELEKATGAVALETRLAVARAHSVLDASLRDGAIVVDNGNYYPSRNGNIEPIDNGMADTAWASQVLSRPLIKAFNNIIAANIVCSARPRGVHDRVTLPIAGNDEKSKTLVMELVDQIGFDPYDVGSVTESWRQHPGTPAYCTEPSKKELVKLLAAADREKAVKMRDFSRAIFEKLPSDYNSDTLRRVSRFSAGLDKFKLQTWAAAMKFLWAVIQIRLRGRA